MTRGYVADEYLSDNQINNMQTSPAFSLNSADFAHIGRHLLFAILGTVITYLLGDVIPNLHVSESVAVFIPFVVTLLTTAQSFVKNNQ